MESISNSLSYIGNYVNDIIGLTPDDDDLTVTNEVEMKKLSQTELAIKAKDLIIKSINDDNYEKRVAVPVIIENLSIKIKGNQKVKDKVIVHPFNAKIEGSSLFAILGGSGSGKTTLLNVIANRIDKKTMIDGKILINGVRNTDCKVGYVMQSDFLLPFLTVNETLKFVAKLKMSKHQNSEEKIKSVVTDLGLKEVADSLIGDHEWRRGLSGGEKRRVSIAIQIMSNPAVLCLDEVTSGLDSFTAQTVMQSLLRLSKGNRQTTVICSVHQPRSDVFYCFDSVLLLSRGGRAIYCGSTLNMIKYFSNIGFPCPDASNPADYFVDLSSIDVRDIKNALNDKIRVDRLINEAKKEENFILNHVHEPVQSHYDGLVQTLDNESVVINKASWLSQVFVLTKRFYVNGLRDTSNILGGCIQSLVLGIMIMGIFWNLADDNLSAIRSRYGLSYIIISAEPYILMIILVQKYCTDLKVFDRELQDDLYKPSAYMAAHLLSSFPTLVIQPFLYGLPIYYGCNMRAGYDHLLIFLAVNVLISFIINGIAWMSVSLQRSFSVASLIANMNFTFIGLTSGFLVNFKKLPIYVSWVKHISYHSYSYRILMSNEFSNRIFGGCSSNNAADCILYNGNFILSQNNVKINDFKDTWVVLFAMIVIYHSIALCILTYIPQPPSGSSGLAAEDADAENDSEVENDVTLDDIKLKYEQIQDENNMSDINVNFNGVKITLNNIHLSVSVPDQNPKALNKFVEKKLLKDIYASIEPRRLVGLMGGSGSGKTTLMNLIAGRLPISSSPSSIRKFINNDAIYSGSGSIFFNGSVANGEQLRQMIGYVQQNDFHIPSLTVTETLIFHANLRLPTNLSINEKKNKVKKVIEMLGLKMCSTTYVGSEDVKGISGGEKRRLTLATCMLTDPTICLIDEVTTGLDTFTARHCVETLHDLARTGRTIILSIHQPRYDVFQLLDDIILLSRGSLVFAGSCKSMINHFSKLSFVCPTLTNPADFILDLSSIDFRSVASEKESRERLTTLVTAFALTIEQTKEDGIKNVDVSDANTLAISTVQDHSILYTLPLLLSRSILNQVRQPALGITRIQQGLSFALILACFYAPVQFDQNSIQNRIGNLYMMTSLCFIGMLNCIAVFPSERNVFYREYIDGGYSSLGFFLAYLIICIPFLIISAAMLSVMMTFAIGLKQTFKAFLVFTYVVFAFMYVGEMIGVGYLSLFYHVGFSVNIMSVFISFFCMMAGFISIKMSLTLERINYISPLKYGAYILTNTIFEDVTFTCDDNEKTSIGSCPIENGNDVLKLYNMYDNIDGDFDDHIWLLAILCFIYTIMAFAILRYRSYKISH